MQLLCHDPAVFWIGVIGAGPITIDEASMESSKSFIKALQVRSISLLPAFPPPSQISPPPRTEKGMILIHASSLTIFFVSSMRFPD
jgi:hypothetical protein